MDRDDMPVVQCAQVIRRPRCPTCEKAQRDGTDVTCYKWKKLGKHATRYYRCNTAGCGERFKAIVV